jgi:hypothetical protein
MTTAMLAAPTSRMRKLGWPPRPATGHDSHARDNLFAAAVANFAAHHMMDIISNAAAACPRSATN